MAFASSGVAWAVEEVALKGIFFAKKILEIIGRKLEEQLLSTRFSKGLVGELVRKTVKNK